MFCLQKQSKSIHSPIIYNLKGGKGENNKGQRICKVLILSLSTVKKRCEAFNFVEFFDFQYFLCIFGALLVLFCSFGCVSFGSIHNLLKNFPIKLILIRKVFFKCCFFFNSYKNFITLIIVATAPTQKINIHFIMSKCFLDILVSNFSISSLFATISSFNSFLNPFISSFKILISSFSRQMLYFRFYLI